MSPSAPRQGELLALPAPADRRVEADGVAAPVARVLLDSPVAHLDRTFDYLVPAELDTAAAVGTRVVVRFGGQEMHGWVWQRGETTTRPGRLAPLRRVVSDLPVLSAATMTLVEAVAQRSAGTRADVLRLAVPARHARAEDTVRGGPLPDLPTWSRPDPGGWEVYGGAALLEALADGGAPRAVWTALPARPGLVEGWLPLVARAVRAALSAGRGALVVVATASQAREAAAGLGEQLAGEPVALLSAELGAERRYRTFVEILLGRARVVVGTRAAAFAPVARLGLVVIWDDGDDRLEEPRAPYVHARTVLALRSATEGCGLVVAGHTRTVEAQTYVERGWAAGLSATRATVRRAVARVEVPGAPELDAEGASGGARFPSLAHRAVRQAIEQGPVLIQVPRSGYAPALACRHCRTPAACPTCRGPVSMDEARRLGCRWCGRMLPSWSCAACGHTELRMVAVGSSRTGEELGRAFPGVPVVVSGADQGHGVVAEVDASPRLVVATPGAEPVARGGYRAVVLLDGAVLSARPELGAAAQALRRWTNAAVLARPDARVILLGGPEPVAAQALVRWDHAGFARRELAERAELHLPPAWRTARLDGERQAVRAVLEQMEATGFETLGPAAVEHADSSAPRARGLVRSDPGRGRELAAALRHVQRERAARRQEPLRVQLDPTLLW
ncbi:MAG: primosomal protein N' [Actinomyces sp.]|uniref:primosomal protein N' family DNA-binding protein n=1 Tax=Actinomyces sp. TaxID=29317 RepID=UPI0026DCCEC4|nr:primosomal protein N' [Actinomyces sp.]MDO4244149.1 primosomal protein N' [Actinomyces sp.]